MNDLLRSATSAKNPATIADGRGRSPEETDPGRRSIMANQCQPPPRGAPVEHAAFAATPCGEPSMRDPARPGAVVASSGAVPAPALEGCQVVGPPTDRQPIPTNANRLPAARRFSTLVAAFAATPCGEPSMRDPARPCAAAASSGAAPAPALEGCQVVGPPTDHQPVANRLAPVPAACIACNKPRRGGGVVILGRRGLFSTCYNCTIYKDTPQACPKRPRCVSGSTVGPRTDRKAVSPFALRCCADVRPRPIKARSARKSPGLGRCACTTRAAQAFQDSTEPSERPLGVA